MRLALADVDVLVDVVWHVVEGLARVRRAGRPVVASLLRVGLLWVIEVDVRRVTEHHLRMTSHIDDETCSNTLVCDVLGSLRSPGCTLDFRFPTPTHYSRRTQAPARSKTTTCDIIETLSLC